MRISPRMRLDDAVREVSDLPFGATDCALPMLYALERKLKVDTFVVVTDNETWAGGIHPHEALARYRMQMGIDAKLAVMATSATRFTIADPSDAGMLDVAGFDATVPALLAAFSRGFAACGARLTGPQRQSARQTPVIVSAIRRCGVTHSLVEQMMADAVEAERLRVASRALLVGAVRRGAAAGMTQREIARAVNRSQPEVARLLRFAPASERGRKLARLRREVIDLASRHGFRDVRVFGSVARGEDGPGSDVDLLAEFPPGASLFQIGEVEAALATLLGERVDLVPEDGLRPHARESILAEAVAL